MAGTEAANATVPGVPAFGGEGALRLRLAKADGGDAPFAVLHEGLHGRVHVGEVVSGAAVVARFAWKLRADRMPDAVGRAPTNGEVDAQWQRERDLLAATGSPHVVAPFPVDPAVLQSPPLWYCVRTERWFHPVCPDTGALLRVCRDDDLLTRCGLPPYAGDNERYLHGGEPGASRVFYQPRPAASRRAPIDVRGREQLIAGFGDLVRAPVGDARVARAATALPCLSCPQRTQCYPADVASPDLPAQRALHVVAFFDVDAVATELHHFDYDETSALLGGGDVDDVLGSRTLLGRDVGIGAAVRTALAAPGQWQFGAESARWIAEVALRKVDAFLQLLDGLAAVHASGRPHLGLVPGNVLGSWRGGGGAARRGLGIALHDLGSAMVKPLPTPGGEVLCEPGRELLDDLRCRPYLLPAVLTADGQSLAMAVACYRTGENRGRVRFVVDAQAAGVPRSVRAGDLVLVQPVAGGASLVARIAEVRARGLLAEASLPDGHPCLQWDGGSFEARVAFHRHLGLGADCHGLGVLLARLLLVDDEQGLDEVMDALGRCQRWLDGEPAAVRAEPTLLATRLQQLAGGREVRGVLEPTHLLHRRADRDAYGRAVAAGAAPLDGEIWGALLAIVCRLLGDGQPGGFATGPGDDDPMLTARLAAELRSLQRRLEVELYDVATRDGMLAALARERLAHLDPAAAAAVAGDPGAAADGFTLVVRRENGELVREVAYAGERLTIGRRDDNGLQLADPMVSSAHAAIERGDEGWVVVDRASTNGTEVDGIRLPVEVPQPLVHGSVIGIRPFLLTVQLPQPDLGATIVSATVEQPLRQRLHAAWAAANPDPALRMAALVAVVDAAQRTMGSAAVAARLREFLKDEAPAAAPTQPKDAVAAAAAQGLALLSRALLGAGEFRAPQEAQAFAAKLARFVEATSQGIERLLALRKALGKHLDLGLVTTQHGAPPMRTAADVRQVLLGWEEGGPTAEVTGLFVLRFYDDLLAILGGLLRGNQQVRRAVRERLDPAQLVESVGREAKVRLLVQAAAGSALWKAYAQAFADVTGNEQYERELEQLLQQALPDLRPPGTTGA